MESKISLNLHRLKYVKQQNHTHIFTTKLINVHRKNILNF